METNMELMNSIMQAITDYSHGQWSISIISGLARTKELVKSKAQVFAESLLRLSSTLTLAERMAVIKHIKTLSRQIEPKGIKRLQSLKKALGHEGQWSEALLGIRTRLVHNVFFKRYVFDDDAKQPLVVDATRFADMINGSQAALVGSHFVTDQPHLQYQGERHVLDAVYSAEIWDKQEHITGFAFGLADGCGGHYGDAHQDQQIAKAAHLAAKHAVRLLATQTDANVLAETIPELVKLVALVMRQQLVGSSSTLLAGRVFIDQQQCRLVGFNLGDGALISWHPAEETLMVISPSYTTDAGPAELPDGYKELDIRHFDVVLPIGALLLPMSDGLCHYLPHQTERGTYPNNLGYQVVIPDSAALTALFKQVPARSPASVYLKALAHEAVRGLNQQRVEKISQGESVVIGDDISALGMPLLPPNYSGSRLADWIGRLWPASHNSDERLYKGSTI